ncbi:MAG: rRNA maturation RNase YbeY [Gammaproteobacteria bacterium]|jgi:probable rRNA maturation factor|nr:rRNA maturation RNase YbeY [Gammaproteobacteria bacterium]
MNLTVDIQCASRAATPNEADITRWINAALQAEAQHKALQGNIEVSVRVVDAAEMTTLNETYRGKSGSTNVLSFPADLHADVVDGLLGDVVICAPVVNQEAATQHKAVAAHWAHMAVHGTLHLLGYDHVQEADAQAMESLETAILGALDFPCPYGNYDDNHSDNQPDNQPDNHANTHNGALHQ